MTVHRWKVLARWQLEAVPLHQVAEEQEDLRLRQVIPQAHAAPWGRERDAPLSVIGVSHLLDDHSVSRKETPWASFLEIVLPKIA